MRILSYLDTAQLFHDYKMYKQNIQKMQSQLEKYKNNIITISKNEKIRSLFANNIIRELETGEFSDNKTKESLMLLNAIDKYLAIHDYTFDQILYYKEHELLFDNLLKDASPAKNPFSWTFSDKNKQERANKALQSLMDEYKQLDLPAIYVILNNLNSFQFTSEEESWNRYCNDSSKYIETLNTIAGIDNYRGKSIPGISEITDAVQKIAVQYNAYEQNIKEYEKRVRESVNMYRTNESLALLKDVPVEELGREAKGLRTGILRSAGYETVSDVIAAGRYELSSLQGISEDAAYTIKRVADQYSKNIVQNCKIKLSTDDKDFYSSGVIYSIRNYIDYKNNLVAVKEMTDDKALPMASIGNIRSGIEWLFRPVSQKQQDHADYMTVLKNLNGATEAIHGIEKTRVEDFKNIYRTDKESYWKDFEQNPVAYFNVIEELLPGILSQEKYYGLPEELAREIQDEAFFPNGLLCKLRNYQEWGVKYILHQGNALLGDEMGLGKTVQSIATMVSLKNTGETHFMVVCPASVIVNWIREIRKHSKLNVVKIHGAGKQNAFRSWLRNGGVAVTTYETTGAFTIPDGKKFGLLIVDEAHYIKNPAAKRTENVVAICEHAERHLFLTGTALENKVDEMISLVNILNPSIATRLQNIAYISAAPQFRETVAPVYYRRKREDVLTELPEMQESEEWCTLTRGERFIYENAVLEKKYAEARRVSWNVDDYKKSSKANRLMELVEDAQDDNRKILVFSFFLDTLRKVNMMLGDLCVGTINGSVSPGRRQEILDDFEKAPPGSVLTAQIQSGGTGLNIQSASVVIFCEPQLKPSIENQAISRAYRMGQVRKVLVYRLLCERTIDEKISEMLKEKQAIFDAFADKSVAAEKSLEIDDKTFGNIIQEEIDRINKERGIAVDYNDVQNPVNITKKERKPTVNNDNKEIKGNNDFNNQHDSLAAPAINQGMSNKNTTVNNSYEKRPVKTSAQDKSYLRILSDEFETIDNSRQSGIFWVIYNKDKEDLFLEMAEKYRFKYSLEKRGALATNGRKAYRIMTRR